MSATAGHPTILAAFQLPSEPGNERLAMAQVAEAVAGVGLPPAKLERLKTAVAEATMNAIEHGNHNQPEVPVDIEVTRDAALLRVRITDSGGGDGGDPDEPDLEAKLAGAQTPRGWGLFLIRNMVDELSTTIRKSRHTLELVVHLNGEGDASDTL